MRPEVFYRHRIVLLAALLLVGGCGEQRRPTGQLSSEFVAERVASAHLVRSLTGPPRTLDPAMRTDVPSHDVLDELYEGLLRLGSKGELQPGVAERWTVSADGLRYEFKLRKEARWSNGDPVTSQQFVEAWRHVIDPLTASPNAQQLLLLRGADQVIAGKAKPEALAVSAPDDRTLIVELAQPIPYFEYQTTTSPYFPIHFEARRQSGEAWLAPGKLVGNGAFLLESRDAAGILQLQRNPNYWDAKSVQLQRVTFLPMPDNVAAVSRFLSGNIDVSDSFPIDDLQYLRDHVPESVSLTPIFGTVMFAMNTTQPPFDSRELRQAMVMALDREALTQKLLRGTAVPAYGWVPPLPGYEQVIPEWSAWPAQKREAEARTLYARAGYSRERPLRVELVYPTSNPETRRIMEALAAMWRMTLGAEVRLVNQEFRVYLQNRELNTLNFLWYAWFGDYPDPLAFLGIPVPGSGYNAPQYDSAAYQALLNTATQAPDPVSRMQRYHEAEQFLLEEAVVVPIYYYVTRKLVRPYVKGFEGNAVNRHPARAMSLVMPQVL